MFFFPAGSGIKVGLAHINKLIHLTVIAYIAVLLARGVKLARCKSIQPSRTERSHWFELSFKSEWKSPDQSFTKLTHRLPLFYIFCKTFDSLRTFAKLIICIQRLTVWGFSPNRLINERKSILISQFNPSIYKMCPGFNTNSTNIHDAN